MYGVSFARAQQQSQQRALATATKDHEIEPERRLQIGVYLIVHDKLPREVAIEIAKLAGLGSLINPILAVL